MSVNGRKDRKNIVHVHNWISPIHQKAKIIRFEGKCTELKKKNKTKKKKKNKRKKETKNSPHSERGNSHPERQLWYTFSCMCMLAVSIWYLSYYMDNHEGYVT